MENEKEKIRRAAEETADFRFNDSYFLDDDVPYSSYNGLDAEEIVIPLEEEIKEETVITAAAENEDGLPAPSEILPLPKKVAKKSLNITDILFFAQDQIEYLGAETIALFRYFYRKLSPLFIIPSLLIFSTLKKLFIKLKKAPSGIHISLADDIKRIILELKAIFSAAGAVKKKKVPIFIKALSKYFIMSFKRHSHFWKTLFNLALPAATVFAVVFIYNALYSDTAFALEVFYNGKSLGYVESADVFDEGKAQALSLISSTEDNVPDSLSLQPVYKFSRVKASQLSNSQMISEGIILSGDESYIRACGIYINGEFICAVKNESDAVSVFAKILEPYKKNADKDAIVGFVEEIDYVQGYYSENSASLWDTASLQKTLSKPKSAQVKHKIKDGDSLASIAKQYNTTRKKLKSLNPGVDFSDLSSVKSVLISEEENYVRVKVMKTRTRSVALPYETIERNSSSLAKGTKKTTQNGAYGEKVITEMVTYIDGEISYTSFVSERQTKAPVNKIVLIGTKTYSSPVYGGSVSSSGFTWPTRGAYAISSRYGYRSPSISGWGFHGGVDIIRYGGSSGIPVVASASGTVVSVQRSWSGYGHMVLISHGGGISTRYAHMQAGSISVRVGQYVYRGQQIGRIGSTGNSTGPHLHFEVIVNGSKVNPLNYIK